MVETLKKKSFAKSTCSGEKTEEIGRDMWTQLEKVSIPVFDGEKAFYDGWRAAFDSCIDSAPSTAEYKLLQMKQYLTGEPLKVIAALGHSATAYENAKCVLCRQ